MYYLQAITTFVLFVATAAQIQFNPTSYFPEVSEEQPVGTEVVRVGAAYVDSFGILRTNGVFSMPSGGDAMFFTIETVSTPTESRGIIRTASVFDRDALNAQTEFFFTATYTTAEGVNSSVQIHVFLADINDNAPSFTDRVYTLPLFEGTPGGADIFTVTATDPDVSLREQIVINIAENLQDIVERYTITNGRVLYNITSGNSLGHFELNAETGTLSLAQGVELDIDSLDFYNLTVMATDGGGLNDIATVIINVLDSNDNTPQILSPLGVNLTIPEDTLPGYVVVDSINATDLDRGVNAEIRFLILSGDITNSFTIDEMTGRIIISAPLDREMGVVSDLTVAARDQGLPQFLQNTLQVVIQLLDVNDYTPQFTQPSFTATVNENSRSQTSVLQIQAIDLDEGPNGTVTYAILKGGDSKFSIDPLTGVIVTNEPLDREENNSFALIVGAFDNPLNDTFQLSSEVNVTIAVGDLNDNSPIFLQPSYETSILDNLRRRTEILQVFATDDDSGTNGQITYVIDVPDPTNPNAFAVNATSGVVYLNRRIRFENQTLYNFTVQALDGGAFPLTANTLITIFIHNVNENPPVFDQSDYNVTILETTNVGVVVVNVSAQDLDVGLTGEVRYRIVTEFDEAGSFGVDETSGQVFVNSTLDFDFRDFVYFIVEAYDGGFPQPFTDRANVTIFLIGENDEAPSIIFPGGFLPSVPENEGPGIEVVLLSDFTSDPDFGMGGLFSFSLVEIFDHFSQNDSFHLNETTGLITSLRTFDRELYPEGIVVAIRTLDFGDPQQSKVTNITVLIRDKNDNAPYFETNATAQVYEFMPSGITVLANYSALDDDIGINARVEYDIRAGEGSQRFTIDPVSGVIFTTEVLNKTVQQYYNLTIIAVDQGMPRMFGFGGVMIEVLDANDQTPVFSESVYNASLSEADPAGTLIAQVNATDADVGTNAVLNYYLTPNETRFTINSSTGEVFTNSKFDRESEDILDIEVLAIDNGLGPRTGRATVRVYLQDINDNPPVFNESVYNSSVIENAENGTVVTNVLAVDGDAEEPNNIVTYSLSGNRSEIFSVNSVSGEIVVSGEVDWELGEEFTIIVVATDGGTPQLTATTELMIFIEDVNDRAPNFIPMSLNLSILENTSSGNATVVGYVQAIDLDSRGNNSLVTYSILMDFSNGRFQLDSETGLVTFVRGNLDRERRDLFDLEIRASDHGNPQLHTDETLYITVQDSNEFSPVFDLGLYVGSVAERTNLSTSVLTVHATDVDIGSNGELRYSIPDGNIYFQIDEVSGVVYTASELFDFESQTIVYEFEVFVTDLGTPMRFNDSALVRVTITDSNDNVPLFTETQYSVIIRENLASGTTVLRAVATDADSGTNAEIEYTLHGEGNENFGIDPQTGVLYTNQYINREETPSFDLIITANNSAASYPLYSTVQAVINITDLNDMHPTFELVTDMYVPEDASLGSVIFTLNPQDGDEGLNGSVVFTLVQGNTEGYFDLDRQSGNVTLVRELDYELQELHIFVVMANDSGTPSLSNYTNVLIHVVDVNDNLPQFFPETLSTSISFAAPIGTTAATVQAHDRDSGSNAELVFSIISGNDFGLFEFSSTNDGALRTVNSLQAYSSMTISLLLSVSNLNSNVSDNGLVDIHIQDGTGGLPRFTGQPYTTTLSETATAGDLVFDFSGQTVDITSFSFVSPPSLVNGTAIFEIDSALGTVRLVSPLGLDYETQPLYLVTVLGQNSLGDSAYTVLNIIITDENEHPPLFISDSFFIAIPETTPINQPFFTVMATDQDGTSPSNVISYSIATQDVFVNSVFRINQQTGELVLRRSLDFEFGVRNFNLTVAATNDMSAVRYTSESTVMIEVLNGNSFTPVFSQDPYVVVLFENATVGLNIVNVSATDLDMGSHGDITYGLHGDHRYLDFSVDTYTGQIFINADLDYERQTYYSLQVVAADGGNPSRSVVALVLVQIQDLNDNSPIWEKSLYVITIPEDLTVGTFLIDVLATDIDQIDRDSNGVLYITNGYVTYNITEGDMIGQFFVDPDTGFVTVASSLNREMISEYNLTLRATDGGGRFSDAYLYITLTDVNDQVPAFTQSSYTVGLPENSPNDTLVVVVQAIDTDLSLNSEIFYQFSNSSDEDYLDNSGTFYLNDTTGEIYLTIPIDREVISLYTLVVEAVDMGASPLTGVTEVLVQIVDINEFAPEFTESIFTGEVFENEPPGTSVLQVFSTDGDYDENSTVLYSIVMGNTLGLFTIIADTGIIQVANLIDFEFVEGVDLIVMATDSGPMETRLSNQTNVTIFIMDRNDNPPLLEDSYTMSISEDSILGDSVLTVFAGDVDSGINAELTYTLNSLGDMGVETNFDIDPESGEIFLTNFTSLDRELRASYEFVVNVTDQGTPQLHSTAPVTVIITDVNDNTPQFTVSFFQGSLFENLPSSTPVVNVSATDADEGTNAHIVFELVDLIQEQTDCVLRCGGIASCASLSENQTLSNNTPFGVDQQTGELYSIVPLDRETVSSYVLVIQASDSAVNETQLTNSTCVFVSVLDQNDEVPTFSQNVYQAFISEYAQIGDFVVQVFANDRDAMSNAEVTFELASETGNFAINPSTGDIFTLIGSYDRETRDSYNITVLARDGGNVPLTSTAVVMVTILDENDSPPLFSQSVYSAAVFENLSPAESAFQAAATDLDIGSNANLTYSILTVVPDAHFNIDPISAVLFTTQSLDREDVESYLVTIVATDGGLPALTGNTLVNVTVLDANDLSPVFVNLPYSAQIGENSLLTSQPLTSVNAIDGDIGTNAIIVYTLDFVSPASNAFEINATSGEIHLVSVLDAEYSLNYSLFVNASNGGALPGQSSVVVVDVQVIDLNDNAPYFEQGDYILPLVEATPIGDDVIALQAFDDDVTNQNSELRFEISGGFNITLFDVNSTTGVVYVAGALDRETEPVHVLEITVSDTGITRLIASTNLTIILQDSNDNDPIFEQSDYTFSINENLPISSLVGRIQANDLDVQNVTYYLMEADSFRINSTSGEIFTSAFLDREQQELYSFIAIATDGGLLIERTAEVVVNVTLLDLNDVTPLFQNSTYVVYWHENTTVGSILLTVEAFDEDVGENSTLLYSILPGNDSSFFSVNQTSGEIQLDSEFDREEQDVFSISLTAYDLGSPSLTGTAAVQIHILDNNDNLPVLNSSEYRASLFEDTAVGSAVISVGATDRDIDRNANISYFLTGDFNGTFAIGKESGVIILAGSLDYEAVQSFSFMVVAQDDGVEPLSSTSQVFIEVIDLNDNPPVFDSNTYTVSVPENSILGTLVFQIPATDADATSNSELRYSITSGNLAAVFSIDESFGLILMSDYLDREIVPFYSLGLRVVDSGTPQFTATAVVEVNVLDVNDHHPRFESQTYSVTIPESLGIGMDVFTIEATDLDSEPNANLTYSIIEGNANGDFQIDSSTGVIQTAKELDFETVPSYTLTILVSDNGSPLSLSDSSSLRISITDTNEHPPSFSSSNYLVNVSENTVVGTPVGYFVATDEDSTSKITYNLLESSSFFAVDRLEGTLYASAVLRVGMYVLTLEARDGDHVTNITAHVTVVPLSLAFTLPLFGQAAFYFEISETAVGNSVVGNFGQGGVELVAAVEINSVFEVDTNGTLILIGQLDHETTPTYIFNVMTTYSSSEPSLYAIVTVRILDENDNAPVLESSKYNVIISELTQIGTPLLTVRGFDIDSPGVNSEFTITLSTTGNTGGNFEIDPSTGDLEVIGNLDYETQSYYNLTAVVTNHLASPPLSSTAQVLVELNDENDNDPVFSQTIYQVQVPSSTPLGMEILSLEASDFDSGSNSELVFAITHISIPYSFVINGTTGSIATNTTFDLRQDITSSYVISALVSDRGSPQPRSDTTIIFVDITPDNLYPPQFSQPEGYAVVVPETLPLGSSIVESAAIDLDSPTEIIVFSITSGDPSGKFSIDPSNGLIELSMPLDYTEQMQYMLTISAVDSGTPPRTAFVGVNVSLIDINDHDPQFVQAVYEVEVFENITTGSSVLKVTATDPDAINVTYQITVNVYENNLPLFSINATSGEIFTAALIDREFADVLEILVSAIDSGYPVQRSNSILVTVAIGDLNDNAPVFNQSNYTIPVVRLLGPEQPVAIVTATDADIVGDKLTYSISQDDSNGLFTINSTTAQIVTTFEVPEALFPVYNLTVTAFDGQFETAVPVVIQLVNDGEFYNSVSFCTRVREVNCTFDIFPYTDCNPFCLGDFGLSPRRQVCISHYCMDPNLVPCVTMETCLPSNRACAEVCPEGMSVCPTTDLCHVTSLAESCDFSNETCLVGQTLVQREDNSRYCTLSENLSIPGQHCTSEGMVFCNALDECHNLTEPFLCQACPGDLQLCVDTGECVTSLVQCCGPNGNYCDVLNMCLEVGARCELPNIAPGINSSLIYLETIESFQPGVYNQGHVVSLLLGNMTGLAVDSQGEEVSIAITQASTIQTSRGEWQYALCVDSPTDLYGSCSDVYSNWITIDASMLSETNALVLPNTVRVRFVRRAIELDGAVWLRVKLWDGNNDSFVSPRKDLVRTHVPSFETTLPYTSDGAYSENTTLLVVVILPLITPPSFSSKASLQLSGITEDVVFVNNLGNEITDIVLSVYIPDFMVLAEDRIEGFKELIAHSPQYFEQLLPTGVRDLYYSQVERVNPTRKERQLALEDGQYPGVALSLGSNPRGTWQVSLTGDQRQFVNLSSVLQNPKDLLLVNTTARLRFLPMLDFCGFDYISVRPWDGYWNQSAANFLDNGFLVASELEINSTNSSAAVISSYNFNDWERVEIEVACVPDTPVLLVNQVLLDPIPYRIVYRYERVFTILVGRDALSVRAERERFAEFIQITLQEPVDVKRIYPALENRAYISFSVQGNVFSFSEVNSLIQGRQDTLSDLGFPVVSLSQDSTYGNGAGCPGDEPQHYHGVHVNTLLSRYTSDGDDNFVGMAVVAMDTTGNLGVWQYHRGNWSCNENKSQEYDPLNNVWINFPSSGSVTLSDTRALLLHGNDRVRFLPHPDVYWGGTSNYRTPSILVKVWDNSDFISIPGNEIETMSINTNPIEDTVQSLLYPRGLFSDDVLTIEAARFGCDGVVNSGVVHDGCCVCGGSGASCEGCDSVAGSNAIHDACDVCGGSLESDSCSGCDFVPFSGTEPGQCSECISVISVPNLNALQQYTSLNTTFTDCDGQCYGTAVLDNCDVCSGGDTAHSPNSDFDCADVCFGRAAVDSCDDCTGPGTTLSFNQNKDCTGVCRGSFMSDSCGVCQLASEAGNVRENRDCDNVCFGKATLDGCGFCSGGTTNLTADFSLDVCGVCEGDNTTCVGCDGVVNSGLTTDTCGECGGNDCGCFQLDSITPNRGPRTGGTEVVLQGAGFFLNDSARLGFQFDQTLPNCGAPYIFPNTSASVRITCLFVTADQQLQAFAIPVDQSTIRCITQPTNNFDVYIREFLVQVRIDDGPFSNPIPYFYDDYSSIVIDRIVPSDREVNLLGHVSFRGENFLNTPSLSCLVYNFARCVGPGSQIEIQSPLSFPAAFVSSSEISCQLPAAYFPCQVTVRLTLDGQESGIINSDATTFTYRYGAPRVQFVYFSNDLSNLIIQFDRQVDLALPNSINPNCTAIFRTDTYDLIGGADAECLWVDNSQQQLVISLPQTATVKVTSVIAFINDVVITRHELYSYGISSMTFTIHPERNTISPVAVLNGPRSIPFCGRFSFSGIDSQYPGYGSFEYHWSIHVQDSSTGNYSQIVNQLDSFGLTAPVITLTSDLFLPDIEYYLQLYVVNSIGLQSETESILLLKETEPRPFVVILGMQTKQLNPGEDLIIQSVVVPSQCDHVTQAEYTYIWTLTKIIDQRRNLLSNVDLSNIQTQSPEIVIPSSYLEHNSSYTVSLQVTAVSQSSPTQALLRVSVLPLLLQARVNGGNRTVSLSREIVLDARSSSQNPSLSSATFIWSCKVEGSLEACYNSTLTGLIPVPISLPGSDYITFPASDLEPERTYVFTVQLQQEGALSGASVSVEIVSSRPPIVEINNPESVVHSTEPIYLEGLVYSSVPVETVYWESLSLLGQGTVDLSDTNIVQSQTTYLPLLDITQTTSLTDYLAHQLEASIATNSTSRAALVVSANTLTPNLRYTFRLTAVSREGTSYSQVTIVPSSPPLLTRLVSTPSRGVALETEFVFDTQDTIDDTNDSPFLYAFGIVEDANIQLSSTAVPDHVITWMSGVQTSNRLTAVLPSGEDNSNSTLIVLVRVFNRNGESSDALTEVTVLPNVALTDEASYTTIVNGIENDFATTKNWNSGLSKMVAVLLELNKANDIEFVDIKQQILDLFIDIFESYLPPSLTHYQLATSVLTQLSVSGIVDTGEQAKMAAALYTILQWYDNETSIEHVSLMIPSQSEDEPLFLQSTYTQASNNLLSGTLAMEILTPLKNLLTVGPNPVELSRSYVDSVDLLSRIVCKESHIGEEAIEIDNGLSKIYTKLARPEGAFNVSGVFVNFKESIMDVFQTQACVGANIPCMETCFSGVLYTYDLLGNSIMETTGTQLLQLKNEARDTLLSEIEGSDPQSVELFSDVVSVSIPVPSQNTFLQISDLDSPIQVLFPKNKVIPIDSQPLCIYREVGGGRGFLNSEWLLDTASPPQTTPISGSEYFVCEFNHLTEFAVGVLPPPVITTQPLPPTTTPPVTMETTTEPTTMTTRATTEPTTIPPEPQSPVAAIAIVIVLILIIVTIIVVILVVFFIWRKKRSKKLKIEPAEKTNGQEEDARLTKAGPLTPEESKVSMQVILCPEDGERQLIGKLNVLPSIRLRELRYQLADNFALFKNKPFYFMTRQLCDIEPSAEQQQFVSLVFGDKPIFVREVTAENELTKKHFCVCGNAAQFECSNCSSQGYCSPECQHKHWNEQHQKQCSKLSERRRRSNILVGRPSTLGNPPSEARTPLAFAGSPRRVTLATAPSGDSKAMSPTTPGDWKSFMTANKTFQQPPQSSTSVVLPASQRASLGALAAEQPSFNQGPRSPASLGPPQKVPVGSSMSRKRTLPSLSRSSSLQHPAGPPQPFPRTSFQANTPGATTPPNVYGFSSKGFPTPLQSPLRTQPDLFTRPDPRQIALRPPAPSRHISVQSVGSDDLGLSLNVSRDVRNEPLLESDEEDYETSTTNGSDSESPTPTPRLSKPVTPANETGLTGLDSVTPSQDLRQSDSKPVTPDEGSRQSRPTSSIRVKSAGSAQPEDKSLPKAHGSTKDAQENSESDQILDNIASDSTSEH